MRPTPRFGRFHARPYMADSAWQTSAAAGVRPGRCDWPAVARSCRMISAQAVSGSGRKVPNPRPLGGMHGADGGKARPDHGRRQRALAGLGHRQGVARARARNSPSPIRARRSANGCDRSRKALGSDVRAGGRCRRTKRASTGCSPRSAARWGRLDFVVHAIAFSDKSELTGQICRDDARQFPADARHLLLLVHRSVPPRGAADDRGRQPVDADLCRRRAGHAALQRDGRRQGGARSQRQISRGRSRRRQHPGQRDLGRADQDAGLLGDRRFPLHPQMERAQRAAAAQYRRSRMSAAPGFIC